jgi:hypothetical protein
VLGASSLPANRARLQHVHAACVYPTTDPHTYADEYPHTYAYSHEYAITTDNQKRFFEYFLGIYSKNHFAAKSGEHKKGKDALGF